MKYEYTMTDTTIGGQEFLDHTTKMDLDGWEMVNASVGGKYPNRLFIAWRRKHNP